MNEMTSEEWEKKLLGKTVVEDNAETALEADKIVRLSELPEFRRILPPGAPQTRDYRPFRLNVSVDENNVVNRAYFG